LPIHVYEATTGKPVAIILRPGKTPDGAEVALVLRHVIRRIRARWPRVEVLVRGDSHYGRPEAMSWCERNRVGYVFGLAGNKVLLRHVADLAEEVAVAPGRGRGREGPPLHRVRLCRQDLGVERRVIARVEASDRGADSRFVVTNLAGTPRWLYEAVYCARGQAENLVKAHKAAPRLGPNLVHQGDGEPVPAGAAHRRLLAPACLTRLGAEEVVLARGPVRHAPADVDQSGRPRHRAGDRIKLALPSSYPYRRSLTPLASRPRGRREPRGGVPRPNRSSATTSPDHRASGATPSHALVSDGRFDRRPGELSRLASSTAGTRGSTIRPRTSTSRRDGASGR
jgi:hypothetical protein